MPEMDDTRKNDDAAHGFVADGCRRARAAIEPRVRADVEREFAGKLENASFLKRLRLRRQMEREIQRRVEAMAPSDALY